MVVDAAFNHEEDTVDVEDENDGIDDEPIRDTCTQALTVVDKIAVTKTTIVVVPTNQIFGKDGMYPMMTVPRIAIAIGICRRDEMIVDSCEKL